MILYKTKEDWTFTMKLNLFSSVVNRKLNYYCEVTVYIICIPKDDKLQVIIGCGSKKIKSISDQVFSALRKLICVKKKCFKNVLRK